ncbi:MarR family winged helix-turn-helix transcriptional regulator [Microbacterium pumilum]|uniref:HTH marR-type domain-containing protein n=1 Tax=Microbacterium pumilum TaxID=344165 RepID=A0ABP5D629_9MICO
MSADADRGESADLTASAGVAFDSARLASVISPLRRVLLASVRAAERLPEIPDAQIEVVRALPRGVVSSPGELAERLGLSRPTVSNLLTTMEARGLIARRPAADDRRRVEVLASARALALFERFDEASAELVGEATASLTDADRGALAAAVPALEHLRDALATRHPKSESPHTRKEAE